MLENVNLFISILIQVITFKYIIQKLCNEKINNKNIKNLILTLLMCFLLLLLWKYMFNATKTILMYLILIILFKYIFKISLHESIINNFILFIICTIYEILFSILLVSILKLPNDIIIKYFQLTPLTSILMLVFAYYVFKFFSGKLLKTKELLLKKNTIYIIYFIIILGTAILLSKNINNWQYNKEFFLNICLALIFILILIILIKEKMNLYKLTSDYDHLTSYLEGTETLLEKYQKYNHENKNQLLVVKGLCSENPEIIKYIDSILDDDVEHQNKWIRELKYIPTGGLKGLVSYKINQMIDNKINVTVNITPKLKKIKFKNINSKDYKDICRLIGIYIDNSYEASKLCKKKEVCIESFIKDDNIVVIISNTFNGKIDINSLDKTGYSTKGKGRGIGLSLAKEIIENSKILTQERKIIKNYYYQYLYIKYQ